MLTPRQALLLAKVVDGFSVTGQPVGSKTLAADPDVTAGPSTIRNELAVLEENGLLAHPHTSAGRVPTDAGYRYYVDRLLPETRVERAAALARAARGRRGDAGDDRDALAGHEPAGDRVSAPPIGTTTIRHIEVLQLQPQILMVVVITSTGGVSKKVFTFDSPLDSGLTDWAGSYLNERLVGMGLGARMLHSKLADPSLSASERVFIAQLAPVFAELAETAEDTLYVDGAHRLVSEYRFQDVSQLNALMEMLERRVSMLGVLTAALDTRSSYVRIGVENPEPALQSLSLVAANYGLPQRNLGTVSVIGPTRMDYARAIRSVREAAYELSRFIEELY